MDEDPTLVAKNSDVYAVGFEKAVAVTPLTVDCTASMEGTAAILGLELPAAGSSAGV